VQDLLRFAGALEQASEHPVAHAITRAARDQFTSLAEVTDFVSSGGLGVTGLVAGHTVAVGRIAFLESLGMTPPRELLDRQAATGVAAYSRIAVGCASSARARATLDRTVPTGH
jgi:Cu+-exporting ATPase